jgi:hypothetical protein
MPPKDGDVIGIGNDERLQASVVVRLEAILRSAESLTVVECACVPRIIATIRKAGGFVDHDVLIVSCANAFAVTAVDCLEQASDGGHVGTRLG